MFYALTFITMMCFFPLMSQYKYTKPDCFTIPVQEEDEEDEEEETEAEAEKEVAESEASKKEEKKEDGSED